MRFSRFFFGIVTSCSAMMIGDLIILGMVLFVLYSSSSALSSCIVSDLRSETISTIVIAWGVLLESREDLLLNGSTTIHLATTKEGLVTSESKRSGLLLVSLGLLLEIITYFDASVHMQPSASWITTMLHGIIWTILVLVCIELAANGINLVRIRFKGDEHVDQAH